MEGSHGRASDGFGSLASDLLQRIYTQPVLKVEDRLRALAVGKWWASSLADLTLASLTIIFMGRQKRAKELRRCKKQLLWAISTQPAVAELQLYLSGSRVDPELVSLALHSINRQALRKLSCYVDAGLHMPCPTIFPGLQSLSIGYPLGPQAAGAECLRQLPRLTRLTYLRFRVYATDRAVPEAEPAGGPAAGAGGHGRVLFIPSVPSLCELSLALETSCSLAFRGDMPALSRLKAYVHENANLSSTGTGLSQLEELQLDGAGWARVDFALLPSLQKSSLFCELGLELRGAATVRQATSLTTLRIGSAGENLNQPWMLELLESAPPCLRRLEVTGKWTQELAETMAGLQHLHTLVADSEEDATPELPAGPLWTELQVLHWSSLTPLPLALGGASQLHTLASPLRGLQDLELLFRLPALKHLTIVTHVKHEQPVVEHHQEGWQAPVSPELVRRVLPSLQSLSYTCVDSYNWDGEAALTDQAGV